MADKPRSGDLRVHNVRLHRRGRSMLGTLKATGHHLTFTYVPEEEGPDAKRRERVPAPQPPTLLGEGSTASQASTGSSNDAATSAPSQPSDPSKGAAQKHHPKTKTIWVPYPMINRCVLRPSYLQGYSSSQSYPQSGRANESSDDDSSFPPTFGTSSYDGRPSTESAHLAPYSSPRRPALLAAPEDANSTLQGQSGRSPAIRIRCRDFQMMALHFHPSSREWKSTDEAAREVFLRLQSRCCVDKVEDMLAFSFQPPQEELTAAIPPYDARREFARMGIGPKAAAEGPGAAWRISDINKDYTFSATYPSVLCVPRAVSDNMLKYGGPFRSRSRIPALAYLHFNGGSITRCSQPLIGVKGKRNPQDERLVSAIFSSHTAPLSSPGGSPQQVPLLPPSSSSIEPVPTDRVDAGDGDVPGLSLDRGHSAPSEETSGKEEPVKPKVYGSTRRNLIVDARPRLNVLANTAGGGGIEDTSIYAGSGEVPVDKYFLNIENIHIMRSSLQKVIESLANSDYVNLPPDQEALRKSGWLGHIAVLLEGSDLIARAVGLAGSHVLTHCSDGWDRTSQVSALAQLMLDPHYRTLDGFITLVQKDFLSFGHKFRDRNGILGSEKWFEIENERIAPAGIRDSAGSDSNNFQALGSKALAGAKNWFEKNRSGLFRQQDARRDNYSDDAMSGVSTPPPNPIMHSPPTVNGKDGKEHKMDEKEIAPIFHQFLDSVYQMQRQYPHAFEFNERFLLRFLYQTYAGQYGEFLFNSEQERARNQDKVPPVWPYFLARRWEFTNPAYAPKSEESLLLPRRGPDHQVEVRWWSKLFGRDDKEMNVPRALAPADPPSLTVQPSSVSLTEGVVAGAENAERSSSSDGTLREAKSTPNFSKTEESITSMLSGRNTRSTPTKSFKDMSLRPRASPKAGQETDLEDLAEHRSSSALDAETNAPPASAEDKATVIEEDGDDPLGVTSSKAAKLQTSGLDFAAFAQQNAFQDR